MKKVCLVVALGALVSMAFAQSDTVVDSFESYAANGDVQAKWVGGNNAVANLGTPGGANSTSKYMIFDDPDSYAGSLTATNIVTPAAGNYALQFYYKNGASTDATRGYMQNLRVFLQQGGVNKASFDVPATTQTVWTLAQTPYATLTAAPITVYISKNNGSGSVASVGDVSNFDEMKLIYTANPPVQLAASPSSAIVIGGTRTISISLTGGSGVYTQVQFDPGNIGTVAYTDTSAPFTYAWDTTLLVPSFIGKGTASLRVIGYDNAGQQTSQVYTYNIDNRWGGREQFVTNPEFTGYSSGVPSGWVDNQLGVGTAAATVSADTTPADQYPGGSSPCMKINFAASDYTDRYSVRTAEKIGNYVDLQVWYWGRGSSNRLYWMTSPDGSTWTVKNAAPAAQANSAAWTYAEGTLQNTTNQFGTDSTTHFCLVTHNFAAGDSFYDMVNGDGTKNTGAGVEGWNLY